MRKNLFVIIGWLACLLPVHAQLNWNGTASGDWFTGSNWTPGAVPSTGVTVNINSGTTPFAPVIATAGAQAGTVSIGTLAGQSGQLAINGPGTLTSSPAGASYFAVGDMGAGVLVVSGGGTLTTNSYTVIANYPGSLGTATVTGSNSLWTVGFPYFAVGESGTGTLNVEDGGRVVSTFTLEIGNDSAAVGQVNLSGSNSRITAGGISIGDAAGSRGGLLVTGAGAILGGGIMSVGNLGTGTFALLDGATGTASQLTIAGSATGIARFDGAGTTFAVTNGVTVGSSSTGTMTVSNGAVLTSSFGQIGVNAGANGTAVVTGIGSRWTATSGLTIGLAVNSGSGALRILDGGVVAAGSFIGRNSAVVEVSGAGSQFNVTNSFVTGSFGMNNRLDVTAGASFSAGPVTLTTTATSGVAVNVSGPGTTWNTGAVLLGGSGSSSLAFTNGATASVVGEFILDGSANTRLSITDGAKVTYYTGSSGGGQFRLGVDAYGELLIANGGVLESLPHPVFTTFVFMGRNAGSSARATVTGTGSQWILNDLLIVGSMGVGVLDILDGGSVIGHQSADIGFLPGSSGTVTVSGIGSSWMIVGTGSFPSDNLGVGQGGNGTLRILDGAVVQAGGIDVGGAVSLIGGPLVTGTGYLLATGSSTRVNVNSASFQTFDAGGDGGTGVIDILDGAQVTVVGQGHFGQSVIYSGTQLYGLGVLNVDGAGSRVTYTQTLDVGEQGTGVLNVTNGAFVSNSDGYVGSFASTGTIPFISNGTANVSGMGSWWQNNGILRVGDFGRGTLSILNSGSVTNTVAYLASALNSTGTALVSGTGSVWASSGSLVIGRLGTATLTLADGGLASATGMVAVNNRSALHIGAGGAAGTLGAAQVANNGVVRFNHTDATTFAAAISGTGSLIKNNSGTSVLTGTSTYTGTTAVNAGALLVNGALGDTAVTVANGAKLGGSGSIGGVVSILDGGVLSPGNSPETITLGSLNLSDASILEYELATPGVVGSGVNDLVNVTGALTLDGVLNVTPLANFGIGTYRLINYGSLLTDFGLALGDVPLGFSYTVDTATPNQVNLLVGLTDLQYWDGPNTVADGVIAGGSGTWNNATPNWTNATGSANAAWNSRTAVFSGSTGTITLGDNVAFEGMQFVTDGYVINSGSFTLLPSAGASVLVGSGAGATINAALTGTGGITKGGAGVLTLNGVNTFAGATLVGAGTLFLNGELGGTGATVANGATLGGGGRILGPVNVGNGGILTPFNGTTPTVLRVGSLALNGTSVLDYYLGAPGDPGNSRVDVDGNLQLDGLLRVTDAGGFAAGTYRLMNYGGTLMDAGLTIQSLPAGFNPGDFDIDVATAGEVNLVVSQDGPGFQYWDGTNFAANGQIDGGGGVWTLTDTNWTNAAGNINGPWAAETAVFTSAPGTVTLGDNVPFTGLIFAVDGYDIVSPGNALVPVGATTIQVVPGATATINAPLIGAGTITKTDAGTLILGGSQASSIGGAIIQQGSLYVNTVLQSPFVNVLPQGFLGGNGTIMGNVFNNGTMSPGNSPGIFTINGNYTQGSSGTLLIEIASLSVFDRLIVSGNASLAGTLQVSAGKLKYGQQYAFLQAGSISGEFDQILMPQPGRFRGRFLAEGGTGILLVAPASYTLVAETTNQHNVARALDSFIPARGNDREVVSTALDLLTAEQYPAAFDQIAPTFYESLADITIEQINAQNQMLTQRLGALRLGAAGFQAVGIEAPLVHDKDGKSVLEARDAKNGKDVIQAAPDNKWGVFAMGSGIFAKVSPVNQLPNYRFEGGGFVAGLDYRWNESFATGLYAGYQGAYAKYDGGSTTSINGVTFGGYATYQKGGFHADAIVGGGYNGYDVRRSIEFSTVDRTARSNPGGGNFTTYLNFGHDWKAGGFTFGPILGGQYTYAGIGSFTESGADSLDLKVGQQNANSIRTTLGGHIAYTWNVTENIVLIPEIRMFWQHEFLENPRNIGAALDGGAGPGFGYQTSAPDRDAVFAGAGVAARFGEDWNAFFSYNTDFGRQDYLGHSISGGLGWKF